jgi:hypothetical protein
MLVTIAVLAGLAAIPLALGWLSAESRPGFLDPEARPDPFVTPIREEHVRR